MLSVQICGPTQIYTDTKILFDQLPFESFPSCFPKKGSNFDATVVTWNVYIHFSRTIGTYWIILGKIDVRFK